MSTVRIASHAALAAAALALLASPTEAAENPEMAKQWTSAQIVFTGTLDRVTAGPVGRSYPPMYTHRLELTVREVLRGPLEAGKQVTCQHVARQHAEPKFPEGKLCLVAASASQESLRIEAIEKATPELVDQVRSGASIPLGWKSTTEGLISPWASIDEAWPVAAKAEGPMVCVKTGRPALLAGPGIAVEVEKVPPPQEIKWTNPDGDGEYKITVTNTTDKPIEVPALLYDGEDILWNESLVVLCQDKTYPVPGSRGVKTAPRPTRLDAGQSVSTVVNALGLQGPEWPRGGYRIEFQFCLGEKSNVKSFYYLLRHHDKVRGQMP